MATVLTVPYRGNAVALAKQLASLDRISDGRLTLGLALGGWPQDYELSGEPLRGRGARLDRMLAEMRQAWTGELRGASGPLPALPAGRPTVLFGGMAPATFRRMARSGEGWVAPFFGYDTLRSGIASARREWDLAGRAGRPRIVAERYFSLGPRAGEIADEYLHHYYGAEYAGAARADTVTTIDELAAEAERLATAGVDDLLFFPCAGHLEQVRRLADSLGRLGWPLTIGHPGADKNSVRQVGLEPTTR